MLHDFIAPYRSLSLIGMCKNAGKTTALNRLIRELDGQGERLAMTSIGRDGENKDVVTATPKPAIYVREGTLIATAAGMLPLCDITREIVDATGIFTPVGEVVLVRARSDGKVQLAGPSTNDQLAQVGRRFMELGADKILFDGAISRKSLCSRAVSEATVLCTGASYDKRMERVIDDTVYIHDLLRLPALDAPAWRQAALAWQGGDKVLLLDREGGPLPAPEGKEPGDYLHRPEYRSLGCMVVRGALTDSLLKPVLQGAARLEGVTLAVRDSSKILLTRPWYERALRRGLALRVLDDIRLTAITVNPVSAYGYAFDKRAFQEGIAARVAVPVINVEEECA